VRASSAPAAAAAAGQVTKDEIVPITRHDEGRSTSRPASRSVKEVTLDRDEGIRADTTYEGVSQIKPAIEGGVIAAGNASQFSDGAAPVVVMERSSPRSAA
jgi:acetyl-CoA C-acetyltransferase